MVVIKYKRSGRVFFAFFFAKFNVMNLVKLKTYLQEQGISASSYLKSLFALVRLYNS